MPATQREMGPCPASERLCSAGRYDNTRSPKRSASMRDRCFRLRAQEAARGCDGFRHMPSDAIPPLFQFMPRSDASAGRQAAIFARCCWREAPASMLSRRRRGDAAGASEGRAGAKNLRRHFRRARRGGLLRQSAGLASHFPGAETLREA